jgi:hypothetical protein
MKYAICFDAGDVPRVFNADRVTFAKRRVEAWKSTRSIST